MKRIILTCAAALSLVGGASFAQPAPSAPPKDHMVGDHASHERPDPAEMAKRHAQRLRDALQLRPDQEPALRALMEAVGPADDMMRHGGPDDQSMARLTTPERLDRMRQRMAEHQAVFERHAEAIKRFYAQLTPAQQRAFDAMPMRGMGHHGMGHQGPMGHMGGPDKH